MPTSNVLQHLHLWKARGRSGTRPFDADAGGRGVAGQPEGGSRTLTPTQTGDRGFKPQTRAFLRRLVMIVGLMFMPLPGHFIWCDDPSLNPVLRDDHGSTIGSDVHG